LCLPGPRLRAGRLPKRIDEPGRAVKGPSAPVPMWEKINAIVDSIQPHSDGARLAATVRSVDRRKRSAVVGSSGGNRPMSIALLVALGSVGQFGYANPYVSHGGYGYGYGYGYGLSR